MLMRKQKKHYAKHKGQLGADWVNLIDITGTILFIIT